MSSLRHLRNVLLTLLYPTDMARLLPDWHPLTLSDSRMAALVSSGSLFLLVPSAGQSAALLAVPRNISWTGMTTRRKRRS